jgi:hypothetical protein
MSQKFDVFDVIVGLVLTILLSLGVSRENTFQNTKTSDKRRQKEKLARSAEKESRRQTENLSTRFEGGE